MYGYCSSVPKKLNGKYETKYMIAPAAAPALAVSTQTVHFTYRIAQKVSLNAGKLNVNNTAFVTQ